MSKAELHHGDCLEVMKTLPAGSVDAVITDPPYGIDHIHAGGRTYARYAVGASASTDTGGLGGVELQVEAVDPYLDVFENYLRGPK